MIDHLRRSASFSQLNLHATATQEKATDTPPRRPQDDESLVRERQQLEARFAQVALPGQAQPLTARLRQLMEQHRRHDRAWQQDWVGSQSHSNARREHLQSLPGGHRLAAQYGFTFALADTNDSWRTQHSLEIKHPTDSHYLRDMPSRDFTEKCKQLYKKQVPYSINSPMFVNSRATALQILEQMPMTQLMGKSTDEHMANHCRELAPGVFALEFDYDSIAAKAEKQSIHMGGTPSAYQVLAALQPEGKPWAADPGIDNTSTLNRLRGLTATAPGAAATVNSTAAISHSLRQIPANHGLAAMGHTAAALMDTLLSQLANTPLSEHQQHDPLLAEGLKGLEAIAGTLPTLTHDSQRFSTGYRALMEELHLCLAASKPYSLEDFRAASRALLAPQALPASVPQPQMHLMTSGMGALNAGLELACQLTGSSEIKDLESEATGLTPTYYEMKYLRENAEISNKGQNAFFASLNHSLPGGLGGTPQGWNVNSVISALDHQLKARTDTGKPAVLVLDATVEKRDDMQKLMSHFAPKIASGELRMVVCKSYQKYANLSAAKVMAGGIGLVSVEDEAGKRGQQSLNELEADINWMQNDESQLMVHMLRHRDREMAMLDQAVANSERINQRFFHGEEGHATLEAKDAHLPFIGFDARSGSRHTFTHSLGRSPENYSRSRTSQLPMDQIVSRDSFGFSNTTLAFIPMTGGGKSCRISVGHDTPAEMTERFWMASRLMHSDGSQWDIGKADALIRDMVKEALPVNAPPNQSLAQKLALIAKSEQPKISDADRLTTDPLILRQQQEAQQPTDLTISKIASVMLHLSNQILEHASMTRLRGGVDRPVMDALLDAMIDSGMPGVSQATRSSILQLKARLCESDMWGKLDNPRTFEALQDLTDAVRRMPGVPISSDYLERIPDELFAKASHSQQQDILDELFNPLDSESRSAMIHRILDSYDLHKSAACIKRLEQQLDRFPGKDSQLLEPANLSRPTGGPDRGPQTLQAATEQALKERLLKQRTEWKKEKGDLDSRSPSRAGDSDAMSID
ncbi:hypothetical protein ACKC9G_09445 [Pokkaliibacter sp. CJK22405]|uniref:hypothetical protein n=1 Tax=Pokkaliibacter sp. CJK22405 TaxID=3384615 RepID=UPI003984F568